MDNQKEFKDLFSRQSVDYSKFRPTYPPELFQYLASLVGSHELAWDVGTGNGQSAVQLANYFAHVIATDPSAKQLENATQNAKVEYRLGAAEQSPLHNQTADLVTVAQAFHWFDQSKFFAEVQRVLRPNGLLAFWSYGGASITQQVNAVVRKLYRDILEDYWEPERKLVEEGYKSVELPFEEIQPPEFFMTSAWSLDHLVGYLGTWSALQTYIRKNGTNPLEELYPKLQEAWGSVEQHSVSWKIGLRLCRKN